MTDAITQNAIRALLYEAVTNPKPGLVDPISQGPHPDMDIYMFIDSSLSLQPYFEDAVKIGKTFSDNDLTKMFSTLRSKGVLAEKAMFTATHNTNTHKGAIFALGIFTCAESYSKTKQTDLFATIRKMSKGLVEHDLIKDNQQQTAGEKEYQKYGKSGARGEAEDGYPIVKDIALPFLKNSTGDTQTRLLDTLMKIATIASDSNLIKRAGNINVIPWLRQHAKQYLQLGGYGTTQGKEYLLNLNKEMTKRNYSLGGCADLLIVTIFIGLERGYL